AGGGGRRDVGKLEDEPPRLIVRLRQRGRGQPAVARQRDRRGRARVIGPDLLEQRGRPGGRRRVGNRDAGLGRELRQGRVGARRFRFELEANDVPGAPHLVGGRRRERHADAGDRAAVIGGGLLQLDAGDGPLLGHL